MARRLRLLTLRRCQQTPLFLMVWKNVTYPYLKSQTIRPVEEERKRSERWKLRPRGRFQRSMRRMRKHRSPHHHLTRELRNQWRRSRCTNAPGHEGRR